MPSYNHIFIKGGPAQSFTGWINILNVSDNKAQFTERLHLTTEHNNVINFTRSIICGYMMIRKTKKNLFHLSINRSNSHNSQSR